MGKTKSRIFFSCMVAIPRYSRLRLMNPIGVSIMNGIHRSSHLVMVSNAPPASSAPLSASDMNVAARGDFRLRGVATGEQGVSDEFR
jgi:hypothetical protein